MGITEDRNTKQIYFCFVCNGPGTHGWPDGRRVCAGCKRVLQSWNVQGRSKDKPASSKANFAKWQMAEKRAYRNARTDFLQENKFCWVALLVFHRLERSTVIHHRKGRGKYLNDRSTFLATTSAGDQWIHQNEKAARELGFIL